MSASKDSIGRTITVAVLLCVVCSVVVSAAAVLLKPKQIANKNLDRQTNILAAAGIPTAGKDVQAVFDQLIEKRFVDLSSGKFTEVSDPARYDARKAAKEADTGVKLSRQEDIASIKYQAKVMPVYLVKSDSPKGFDKVILPVHGYGLWSTLYGFLALESDLNTVVGLGFYSHAETPGLGGEVDNPNWKALWPGKQVYPEGSMKPELGLIKGSVDPASPKAKFQVDGLSGATLTSRGVTNLVHFWMGENGYAPFLSNLKAGGA
ncbi:Na+-transporting NADH:ubiquinone oxidoreductase subunit C [Amphritea atlantica]|uniref:Na(+)-translocating NADH-quinone reductase subunit C n=1 Tax=Amphritea atlantica TaxID=355243 RepID=A0A1H9I2A4_9GAMM|nr:Na(+)-translocating NADH-quinone reductase subunit C [Amphritea atlantica]SEQ68663.1 Na+-transporting NADH:ubiquinone oxidoreductase subunit C [Amphritea atlantica]